MQLLVSVSDAVEADAALDGGTDIVDAKDPASGPLGPVTLEAFQAIRLRVADVRPLSAALGDPVNQEEAHRMASAFVRNGAGFVKVGFLAARDLGDVRRLLTATVAGAADGAQGHPTDGGAIAVAYADHAGAVTPWQLIDIARRAGATGILLDTANKAGPGLLSLMSSVELRMWMREASSAGLVVGVAGRLSEDDVAQLRDSEADIVGVRGAACIGGRRGHVSADQVRRLRALFTVQVVQAGPREAAPAEHPMSDTVLNVEEWREAWRDLGGTASESGFRELTDRYAEPHRRYHTTQHLSECLGLWRGSRTLAARPGEVAIALWFHDAVYDTKRQDNEERSADLAREAVTLAGLPSEIGDRVHALIMATRHDGVATDGDMQLLVDIDLAILGADAARFDEYERQVREEYAWVPSIMFRRTRRRILEQFLERPRIFQTTAFYEAREAAARQNLQRSVKQLGG